MGTNVASYATATINATRWQWLSQNCRPCACTLFSLLCSHCVCLFFILVLCTQQPYACDKKKTTPLMSGKQSSKYCFVLYLVPHDVCHCCQSEGIGAQYNNSSTLHAMVLYPIHSSMHKQPNQQQLSALSLTLTLILTVGTNSHMNTSSLFSANPISHNTLNNTHIHNTTHYNTFFLHVAFPSVSIALKHGPNSIPFSPLLV